MLRSIVKPNLPHSRMIDISNICICEYMPIIDLFSGGRGGGREGRGEEGRGGRREGEGMGKVKANSEALWDVEASLHYFF